MDKALKELLDNGLLTEEVKESIQEAFEKRINERSEQVREEVETEIREEFARRYDHDRGVLVEAMDRMLGDAIKKELDEFTHDRRQVLRQRKQLTKATMEAKNEYRRKLKEHIKSLNGFVAKQLNEELSEFTQDRRAVSKQRVKLSKEIVEGKKLYRAKLDEHLGVLQDFVLRQLKDEINELAQDRRLLAEKRVEAAKAIREARLGYNRQLSERVKVLERFTLKQLGAEIAEFKQDKDALVESRVKMLREGKDKLEDTRRKFISNAAEKIDGTLETILTKEMTELREDIKKARENNFGRTIFEAFATEFMTSYLSEGTRVKELLTQLDANKTQLAEAMSQLNRQKKVLTEAQTRIRAAEDSANRTRILNELLSPLARDKRAMMTELLEGVRTDNLRKMFNKYLPSVLNEDKHDVARAGRKKLNESGEKKSDQKTVAFTGDRRNRLSESMNAEVEDNSADQAEILQLKMLAGIRK